MKQFLKKKLLPLALFVVAVVSVFAMNTPSTLAASEQFQPLYTGTFCYYHPITGSCTKALGLIAVNVNCTLASESGIVCVYSIPDVGSVILKSCTQDLANPGSWICTLPLYKRTVPSP